MEAYYIAAIGVIGALCGVLIQGLLGALGRASDRRLELLLGTYQLFIGAMAELAAEARTDAPRTAETWRNVIAAKQRILYFAPAAVVQKLANFSRSSQILGQPDADEAFAELLKAMRGSLKTEKIADRDIYRILLGKDNPHAGV